MPVNLAFVGSRADVLAAFERIGWVEADRLSPYSTLRLALAALLHGHYPTAPVSRLYLFGRLHDCVVEHELGSVADRDHVRLWDSGRREPTTHRPLWLANSSRDRGIQVLRRHHVPVGTSHHIEPDLDACRARIVASLRSAGTVASVQMKPGIGLTIAGRDGSGDAFCTDGRVAFIVLKDPVALVAVSDG